MNTQKIVIILLTILCLQTIQAQETLKLSLSEAFQLATQNSKQLQLDSLKMQSLDIKKKQTQNTIPK